MATFQGKWAKWLKKLENTYCYKNSRIYKGFYISDPWGSWMGYKIKNGKMYKVGRNHETRNTKKDC